MEFGDVSFLGNGPMGMVSVGIEYKRIGDAITCMTGGRFTGHQLPGMLQSYQQCWLLVEGMVRCGNGNGSDGVLQVHAWPEGWKDYRQGHRFIMWRDYQHWLMSLAQMTNLRIAHTASIKESAAWIAALYSWWQREWASHRSVGSVYVTPVATEGVGGALSTVTGHAPSLSRLWAMQLPGIGADRSKTVAMGFPTALELATADEDRWQMIDGIGKTLAHKVVTAIRERGK